MTACVRPLLPWIPALLACAYAAWFRHAFAPGNFSYDSLQQVQQALRGVYDDHHPPLPALVLAGLLRARLGVGSVVTLQVVAGLLGLGAWLHALARCFLPRLDPWRRSLAANLAMLALLSPLTPLLFYLVTFWKDSWVAIGMLWTGAGLLMALRGEAQGAPGRPLWAALGVAAGLVTMLSRHNAIALLPVVCGATAFAFGRAGRRRAWVAGLAPALLFVAAQQGIRRGFDVERVHLENVTLVHDLFALCVRAPVHCAQAPYTLGHYGRSDLRERFEPGNVISVIDGGTRAPFDYSRTDPELLREWRRAWWQHPLAMAGIRLRSWARVLNLGEGPHGYFQAGILRNDGGFRHDPAHATARRRWVALTGALVQWPPLRPLLGSHAPWFVLACAGAALEAWRSARERMLRPGLVVFCLPLAYYLSYLPPAATPDFRYMLPATLLLESAALLVGVGWLVARVPRWRGW